MGNLWRAPFFLGALVLAQAANVSTSVFLGFWSVSSIEGWTQSRYMGVYAAIGMSYSLFTFLG
jgi:ATP-binding cassette, subfamily C (CFTR/MRP), member 1